MTRTKGIYIWSMTLLLCLVQTAGIAVYGQDIPRAAARRMHQQGDSLAVVDSLSMGEAFIVGDSIAVENKKKMLEMTTPQTPVVQTDSLNKPMNTKVFMPNPVKATWLALIIPGGGQIYNRKYWKLPIIYGGFAGCAYALTWNNKMYTDYAQAYKDAALNRWESNSINDLLPPGYTDYVSRDQIKEVLRKRKDTYRRFRDMSIFAFIGVYLISVVDAYVDAELSDFDISPDLSMRVEPAVINNQYNNSGSGISGKSVGVQCSFRF